MNDCAYAEKEREERERETFHTDGKFALVLILVPVLESRVSFTVYRASTRSCYVFNARSLVLATSESK